MSFSLLPLPTAIVCSIPKDQNDQGTRHSSHMGGDTLECRVGCWVNQFYIMKAGRSEVLLSPLLGTAPTNVSNTERRWKYLTPSDESIARSANDESKICAVVER